MPTPTPNEDHDEFIDRCMSDSESLQDFPNEDQRLAFCESVWEQNRSNAMDVEQRYQTGDMEVRQHEDGSRTLVGHAAVFDSLSQDLGGFRERIRQGAFAQTLNENQDVRALFNHDSGQVLGRTTNGTLRLSEDDTGLRIEVDPPDTQTARDAMTSIERGDISQMSFAFRVRAGGQEFEEREDNEIIRTLTDVELFEVSPVTFPAYPDTSIALRELRHAQSQNKVTSATWTRLSLKKKHLDRRDSGLR